MSPRSTTTNVLTLALGASVLVTTLSGADKARRPPVGARTAFELIATKSGRKKALRCEAQQRQQRNQSDLKAGSRGSHSAGGADLPKATASETPIPTQTT